MLMGQSSLPLHSVSVDIHRARKETRGFVGKTGLGLPSAAASDQEHRTAFSLEIHP